MSIEHCPRCSARVRVPALAEPESWVRCPRCKLESQLSEMLAAEPPELELIDGPSGAVPAYASALAGADAVLTGADAAGDDFNEFEVASSDTMVVDEDSPTLPLGGVSFGDSFLDEETEGQGAMIGRASATKSEDDELFGFDDNADVAALRTTSEDGNFIDVPADGEAEFNLTPDAPGDDGAAAISPAALGAGLKGIPTGVPRRKKKSGMLPMMIGVVFGGVLGLSIGYVGLIMWWLEQDPLHIANKLPESMQMLVPDKLKTKAVASNTPPAVNPDTTPSDDMMPMTDPTAPGTENGSGDTGTIPAPPSTDPATTPGTEIPAVDPMAPLVPPEKTELPKPATNTDPFGNETPVKPAEIPGTPEAPVKPATELPDAFGNNAPVKPEMPAPVNPLDPGTPVKPAEVPGSELALKPVDPVIDPLAPKPADPLTAPAKSSEPLMLASATFAPADLEQSLTMVMTNQEALAQNDDPKQAQAKQVAAYRSLTRLGEVAGQLKSLGDTPEKSAENLKSLQAVSKKLASDSTISSISWLTAKWLTADPKNRNNGIVLQGIPGTTEAVGKYSRTNMDVPGSDVKLTIVSEYPLLPNAEGKVTVLGVIVEKPMEQIPGYPGPAERVIWVSVGEMEKPAAAAPGDAFTPPAPAPLPAPTKTLLDDPFGK